MTKSEFKRVIEAKNEPNSEGIGTRENKEDYGKKKYIDDNKIEDVRFVFKGRVGLLPFAGDYSNDRIFTKTKCLC